MNAKTWWVLGASLGALAVVAGAVGDHSLDDYHRLIGADSGLEVKGKLWWETAVRYQMFHALALLGVAWIADRRRSVLPHLAGLAMFFGVLVFSGCLYAMGLTGMRFLGAVVPLGGLLLVAGWIILGLSAGGLAAREASETKSAPSKREILAGSEGSRAQAPAHPEAPAAETTA